jgi:hypothetical protein
MSYILFIDESGHDGKLSPYEVLAGVSVEDRELWNLITAIQQIEIECFGRRYSEGASELKGKKILKAKVFRHAMSRPEFEPEDRRRLAKLALDRGDIANIEQLAALGQAKIDFVRRTLTLCSQHRCRAFASIVPTNAPRPVTGEHLRKDYSYLFQRFFYFLEDVSPESLGFVVFDEIEKSKSHLLINQMFKYFRETTTGRTRAGRIIPEPFFVHSELTTAIQLADLVAYILAWGVRFGPMAPPARPELNELGTLVMNLRHRSVRELNGNPNFGVWSFTVIEDLRSRDDRDEE